MMHRRVGRHQGRDVVEATLENSRHRVHILNFGSVVRRWVVGGEHDIVLGFDSFADYPIHSKSFGIVAGRVANRTQYGRFSLNGESYQLAVNQGGHHLHGGNTGLGERVWDLDVDESGNRIRLNYFSPHGEEGYPANVHFSLIWSLDGDGLHCEMRAVPDKPTPINLAQHNYYNLDPDAKDIRNHSLFVDADKFLAVDEELIPTGEQLSVADTRFDFRTPVQISTRDPLSHGHDHTMVLRRGREVMKPAAQLVSPDGRITLSIITDQPGIQLYTAAALSATRMGINGKPFVPFGGICLEAQHFPDSLNHSDFPCIICDPEQPYSQSLSMLVQYHRQ